MGVALGQIRRSAFALLTFVNISALDPAAANEIGLRGRQVDGRLPQDTTLEAAPSGVVFSIRRLSWTDADERAYGEFVAALGNADCRTVDACLKSAANPFRASDPAGLTFRADCADLPYFLRAYFAWKQGLPFAYTSAVSPLGRTRDIRYSAQGNAVAARTDVLSGSMTGPALLARLRDSISSAMYRIHPARETPLPPDHYSASLDSKSIRPGTVIYDPNGHLAVVYRVESDGRIQFIDAHPDNSLTRGTYDKRFARARPAMSAGFKNWRNLTLVGATRDARGVYQGGKIVAARNADIEDHSPEQFYGHDGGAKDADWKKGQFSLNGETLDYYDYLRAKLSGGHLRFEPVAEIAAMVRSNCADLHYRAEAVALAAASGIDARPHPARLPENIYGTDGDWEIYSTPSRDARLKVAFKETRDAAERFVTMRESGDPKLAYGGSDLVSDLLAVYEREAGLCSVTYTKSDGSLVALSYEEAQRRLFRMSFDPYHCPELRWGASIPSELSTCRDGAEKRAWYEAEARLRNQLERTYEARMDHDLNELRTSGGEGKGVDVAPDIDIRRYLKSLRTHTLKTRL